MWVGTMKKRGAKFKQVCSNAGALRIEKLGSLCSESRKVDLLINPVSALNELLTNPSPTKLHWDTLSGAVNLAYITDQHIVKSDYSEQIRRAMMHLSDCYDRAQATGKWRLNGDWVVDIKDALDVYTAQVEVMTRHELQSTLTELVRQLDLSESSRPGIEIAMILHRGYRFPNIRFFANWQALLDAFLIGDFSFDYDADFETQERDFMGKMRAKIQMKGDYGIYLINKKSFSAAQWYAYDAGLLKAFAKRGWIA